MRILFRRGYVLIISSKLVSIISYLIGFKNSAMAFTIFPAIILRNLDHPMTGQWINHERIHMRQMIESFGLFWIYSQFEYLYARIFLKYSNMEAYKYECIKQEAYLNQSNLNYLKKRSLFSTFKNIKCKIKFEINGNYQVIPKK